MPRYGEIIPLDLRACSVTEMDGDFVCTPILGAINPAFSPQPKKLIRPVALLFN
jgi:hypothetical protein